jgi:UDP-N-acetylmuramoyl-L-alanyl-D-glutamate--2,6-diaminopimelate ligase
MTIAIQPTHGMRLDELARELPEGTRIVGDPSVRVFGVRHDSRAIGAGDLFAVRKGQTSDGAKFIGAAKERGAVALLAADGAELDAQGLPVVYVPDAVRGLALAAAAIYEHPSFGIEVVGITGTNGKTTTTHLVRAAIDGVLAGPRCALIGTVGYRFKDLSFDAPHTTPEADELARAMLAMKRAGATQIAMEVSSIAIALGRIHAVRFTVCAFTNLTQDHLDFHGTMEAYGEAKAKLFLDQGPHISVICVDSEFGRNLADRVETASVRLASTHDLGAARGVIRVSARVDGAADADLAPTALRLTARGIEATLKTPRGPLELRSPLVGEHNVENLVVALGIVHALQLDLRTAVAALADEPGAPGRLERCDGREDDVAVLVDYAHTPDALARALDALRPVTTGRLVCVFGCGGDRDPTKRGPMGRAVAERADVAFVTSDNPRSEDPAAIAAPIVEAIRATGTKMVHTLELDRAIAIARAIAEARPGDTVLIAGKGHEDYQIIGSDKRHFDDREEARRALAERRSKG